MYTYKLAQSHYTIKSSARAEIKPRLTVPRPPLDANEHSRAVHHRPKINSQKNARSVAGIEPTTFQTAATDDDKGWRSTETATSTLLYTQDIL